MRLRSIKNGFSFIEILVVVAIVLVLALVAFTSLSALHERNLLRDAGSTLMFHLEESRARSVAGTGGEAHGIYFGNNYYVQFMGTYVPSDPSNVVHQLDPALTLTIDILNSEDEIIFSRITGRSSSAASLSVALQSDPTKERVVLVGAGGDISYEE